MTPLFTESSVYDIVSTLHWNRAYELWYMDKLSQPVILFNPWKDNIWNNAYSRISQGQYITEYRPTKNYERTTRRAKKRQRSGQVCETL